MQQITCLSLIGWHRCTTIGKLADVGAYKATMVIIINFFYQLIILPTTPASVLIDWHRCTTIGKLADVGTHGNYYQFLPTNYYNSVTNN